MWFRRKAEGPAPSGGREAPARREETPGRRIVVCRGPTCSSRDSAAVLAAVERGLAARGRREPVFTISCFGQCSRGPNLVVGPRREEQDSILGEAQYFIGEPDEYLYCRMSPAAVEEVIEEHLVHGRPVRRLLAEEGGAGN